MWYLRRKKEVNSMFRKLWKFNSSVYFTYYEFIEMSLMGYEANKIISTIPVMYEVLKM